MTVESTMDAGPDWLLSSDHIEIDNLLRDVFVGMRDGWDLRGIASLDLFWTRLAVHIRAEHLHLFPVIVETFPSAGTTAMISDEFGSPDAAIRRLRGDHNYFMHRLGHAVRMLREHASKSTTASIPPDMLSGVLRVSGVC